MAAQVGGGCDFEYRQRHGPHATVARLCLRSLESCRGQPQQELGS
jgi:hypothetical protein